MHGTLFHQALNDHRCVPLARRHVKGQRFAPTFRTEMDFGGATSATPAQRVGCWIPFT